MLPFKLIFTYFIITLGCSFPFGYHTGVINAPLYLIENFTQEVVFKRGHSCSKDCISVVVAFCVSAFVIGGFFGGFLGGFLAKKYGRKMTLFILAFPSIIGSCMIMLSITASSFELIIFGRFVIGITCGAYTVVGPMFLTEISPLRIRGVAGILNQLVVVVALLISQTLGLPSIMGTKNLWPFLLGLCAFTSAVHFVGLFFCPESPSYLYINKGDREAARTALISLRSTDENIQEELEALQQEFESTLQARASVADLFRFPHLRCAIFVALVPHFGQQWSGINGILYYSSKLFESNGLTHQEASYVNLGIGATILLGTILSMFIIDRFGRRRLLLIGNSITLGTLILFTVALIIKQSTNMNWLTYVAIVMIYIFVSGFSIGPGSIPWFIVAEMFTQENRDAAVGLTGSINWLLNIIVGLVFPQLIIYIRIYAFLPFIIVLVIVLILMGLYLPETKARSPASVEAEFKRKFGTTGSGLEDSTYPLYAEAVEISDDSLTKNGLDA